MEERTNAGTWPRTKEVYADKGMERNDRGRKVPMGRGGGEDRQVEGRRDGFALLREGIKNF